MEITALVLVASLLVREEAGPALWTAALLTSLGIVHIELTRGVEKFRWRIDDELHIDLSSVWLFAAAVLTTPGVAAVVAVLVHGYAQVRAGRARTPAYRHVFSVATSVLATLAASAAMRNLSGAEGPLSGSIGDLGALGLGMLTFLTVNTALVAGAIAVSTRQASIGNVVGEWHENLLELATYCFGALVALTLTVNPWLVFLTLPPLLVLHRAVLVRQLEDKANTDDKTGLLNAAAWHNRAERELRRAERRSGPRAVLVVDLDHFKDVNDRHGHLAGDQVLVAVAGALRAEVRDRDVVGRFGGEEFVVLLGAVGPPEDGSAELTAVAERIRRRIAELRVEMPTPDGPLTITGLSVSVGAALYPEHGRDVRSLMHVADSALYAAKRAGRNTVRTGMSPSAPGESAPLTAGGPTPR